MEIYKLPDKDLKIVILKTPKKMEENTYRQLNKIRKTMHEENEENKKFNKNTHIHME